MGTKEGCVDCFIFLLVVYLIACRRWHWRLHDSGWDGWSQTQGRHGRQDESDDPWNLVLRSAAVSPYGRHQRTTWHWLIPTELQHHQTFQEETQQRRQWCYTPMRQNCNEVIGPNSCELPMEKFTIHRNQQQYSKKMWNSFVFGQNNSIFCD